MSISAITPAASFTPAEKPSTPTLVPSEPAIKSAPTDSVSLSAAGHKAAQGDADHDGDSH